MGESRGSVPALFSAGPCSRRAYVVRLVAAASANSKGVNSD